MTATLLTPDELREHIETALVDDALQRILDAMETEIDLHAGTLPIDMDAPDEVTEWFTSSQGLSIIRTKQRAASITSVEAYVTTSGYADEITAYTEDEEFWVDDGVIRRKDDLTFGNRVKVVYVPQDDRDRRRLLLVNLCKLAINADPGTGFEGAGPWQHTSQDFEEQKQRLLWAYYRPPLFA